jgi:hypothetical protein
MASPIVSCQFGPGCSIHFEGMQYAIFASNSGGPDRGSIMDTNFADEVVSAVNVGFFEVHAFTRDGSCFLVNVGEVSRHLQISRLA